MTRARRTISRGRRASFCPNWARRVLEIGCGIGNFTELLLDREAVIAMDAEPDCVALVGALSIVPTVHAFALDAASACASRSRAVPARFVRSAQCPGAYRRRPGNDSTNGVDPSRRADVLYCCRRPSHRCTAPSTAISAIAAVTARKQSANSRAAGLRNPQAALHERDRIFRLVDQRASSAPHRSIGIRRFICSTATWCRRSRALEAVFPRRSASLCLRCLKNREGSILIPVYNEFHTFPQVLERVPARRCPMAAARRSS